jgi:hypothetical protein
MWVGGVSDRDYIGKSVSRCLWSAYWSQTGKEIPAVVRISSGHCGSDAVCDISVALECVESQYQCLGWSKVVRKDRRMGPNCPCVSMVKGIRTRESCLWVSLHFFSEKLCGNTYSMVSKRNCMVLWQHHASLFRLKHALAETPISPHPHH